MRLKRLVDAAAGIHRGAWERGSVAVRRARATARADAAHWRALSTAADDPNTGALAAFLQGLQELGWTVGRNVRIDYRWDASDAGRRRRGATELVALAPEVILVNTGVNTEVLLQTTRTVPIVFVTAIDPVGAGLVASLARPGGNATGFASYEFSLGARNGLCCSRRSHRA